MAITTRRMHGQALWGDPLPSPVDVVRRLGAVQAQEFIPAQWGLAQRSAANRGDVDGYFDSGAILRTHLLRPTWHFVAATDIRWLLHLTAPRVHAANVFMYRKLELDDEILNRCAKVVTEALRDSAHLTRAELRDDLGRAGIAMEGMRLGYMLLWAELEALICSGPRVGAQQTYALLDHRVGAVESRSSDEALAELTRRYFASRGPATVKDYTKWATLTMSQGRLGLEMVGDELARIDVGDRTYWWSARDDVPGPPSPRIDLVQGYDEMVMSYGESRDALLSALIDPPAATDRPPLLHAILLDGRLVGHWKHTLSPRQVTVETSWYRPIDHKEVPAMNDAVARLGSFFDLPARWH